jgi:hypothetical protein
MSEGETAAMVLLALTSAILVSVIVRTTRPLINSGSAKDDPRVGNAIQPDSVSERLRRSPGSHLALVKRDGPGE